MIVDQGSGVLNNFLHYKDQIVLTKMQKGQMPCSPTPPRDYETESRSVGAEIQKKGSFSVDRAKNGVILCETVQNFLTPTFKNSYNPKLIYFTLKLSLCVKKCTQSILIYLILWLFFNGVILCRLLKQG